MNPRLVGEGASVEFDAILRDGRGVYHRAALRADPLAPSSGMRTEMLLRRRDARVKADAAKAREGLHGRMTYVEARNEAEEIRLDAFDPSKFDADETPQARFHACAAVGQAHIGLGSSCPP
jgi:hypothetical protein